jgi:hypothetical protein
MAKKDRQTERIEYRRPTTNGIRVLARISHILKEISVIPITWQNRAKEVSKLKLKEMESR